MHLKWNGILGYFGHAKTMEKLVRCVRSSPGLFGSAEFDGNWVHLPNDGITGQRTYSLWFKANTLSGNQTLLIKKEDPGAGSVRPITIMLVEGEIVAGATPLGGAIEIGSWGVSAGVWNHVAVHVSPEVGEMYVNGMKVGAVEMDGTAMENAQDYTVGATPYISTFTFPFIGLVYNVKVQPGFVYDGGFEPCEAVGVDATSFMVTGSDEVPCD